MKKTFFACAAAAVLLSAPSFAQTSTTTTTTTTRTTETTFTPAQETTIRKYVVERKAKPVTVKERVVVGGTVPADVELEALPSEIVTEVPAVRSYRYFSTDAGIAVVNPETRRVVRVIQSQ